MYIIFSAAIQSTRCQIPILLLSKAYAKGVWGEENIAFTCQCHQMIFYRGLEIFLVFVVGEVLIGVQITCQCRRRLVSSKIVA